MLGEFTKERTRETSIRRDASGRWYNGDDLITHPKLIRAFSSWISRAEDGRYCLRNDINWAYFTLEGAPLFVRSVGVTTDMIMLNLSNDTSEALDLATLRQSEDGRLYCDTSKKLTALFDSHAANQLRGVLEEKDDTIGVVMSGTFFPIPIDLDPVH